MDLVAHLDYEEEQLQPASTKNLPFKLQKQMVRKIWEHTPSETWAVLVPFILNNQAIHMRRVMFLRG